MVAVDGVRGPMLWLTVRSPPGLDPTPASVPDGSEARAHRQVLARSRVATFQQQQLKRISELSRNWDSYDSSPFEPTVIERTKRLVSQLVQRGVPEPNVVPASSGAIIIEWRTDNVRLEIELDPLGEDIVYVQAADQYQPVEYMGPINQITNGDRRALNRALAYLLHYPSVVRS